MVEKPLNIFERISFFIILNFSKFMIFCFVGLTSAGIDLITFNIFFFLNLPFFVCRILATAVAILYNFSMNRNITFSAGRHSIKRQVPRYLTIYSIAALVGFTTSVIVFNILGDGTFNANIASIAGILVSIPISFLGSLFWAFKNPNRIKK
jgi:putative flippase GtrA